MNICTTGTNLTVPQDPQCYSPCQSGFTDAQGDYRACSVEGLMDGCLDGAICVNGSCVASEDEPSRTCANDAECPDFQVCILGSCYSNCDYDSDCGGMARCYRHSCRVPCSAADPDSCPEASYCELTDSDFGYCMPGLDPSESMTGSLVQEGAFEVDSEALIFTNVLPNRSFALRNSGPRSVEFTVRKVSHRVQGAAEPVDEVDAPLPWLSIGTAGNVQRVDEFTVRVPPDDEVEILLQNASTGVPALWEGVLAVESELGERNLTLSYASSPQGRWAGKVYYFSQFGDQGLDAWMADRSNSTTGAAVGNGFIQKWVALRAQSLPLVELETILTSTVTGSWDWPSTRAGCNRTAAGGACYPTVGNSAGGAGLGRYVDSLGAAPIPSGLMELPIAMDLQLGTGNEMTGRIVSESSLHYPGDPAVQLTFATSPSTCGVAFGPSCGVFLTSLESEVVVGGRFPVPANTTSCAAGQGYDVHLTPWLVPGFNAGTEDGEGGLHYRRECRTSATPFTGTGAAFANANLALANPIPDGRSRRRSIELVDGALFNQDRFVIIFRETFSGDFLGDTAGEPFNAYGIMFLSRVNATLTAQDFVGNTPSVDTVTPQPLEASVACSPDLLSQFGLSNAPANATAIVQTMLDGRLSGATVTRYGASTMHYLCHDTGHFDSGNQASGRSSCPASSRVTYFHCGTAGVCGGSLANHPCQPINSASTGSCSATLSQWIADPNVTVVRNPNYECTTGGAYCDNDRTNLLQGKSFFDVVQPANVVGLAPLRQAIEEAFAFRTQFTNRSGTALGFTPSICDPNSTTSPYCYDPEAIELAAQRVNCLSSVVTTPSYRAALNATGPGQTALVAATDFLRVAYSFENELNSQGQPVTHDGFERLYAELLITLGDEAFTAAFQSRFDLAGQALVAFEGSLFEADGIDLTGVAGFEMYSLYQSAQYYQQALDRFYGLLPYIWDGLGYSGLNSFVSQDMVVTYVSKILRASSQRARAWGEVAKRYQRLERPDLARRVIERAYTATYLESIVISQLTRRIATGFATNAERPQLLSELDRAANIYEIALLDMRELFSDLNSQLNFFGFPPDYIPLPALDPNGPNAVETLIGRARQSAEFALRRETTALNDARSYNIDEAAFQNELVSIRNTYENQLAELCGTFVADGRVYPAIRRYAHLDERATGLSDPCGLMGNGAVHDARANIELAGVDIEAIVVQSQNNQAALRDEEQRVRDQCSVADGFAAFQVKQANVSRTLEAAMRTSNFVLQEAQQALTSARRIADVLLCEPPTLGTASSPGNCIQAAAASGMETGSAALAAGLRVAEFGAQEVIQQGLAQLQVNLINEQASVECERLQVDALPRLNALMRTNEEVRVSALRAEYNLRLAAANATRLRDQARRVEAQWSEAEELSLEAQVARNDPNTRIFKNDAIINAEIAFDAALREAYRATRVFEYYTSQSYARRAELNLVRLVGNGQYNLENYLADLEDAYFVFLETYGRPDARVEILSMRDDILAIPRVDGDNVLTMADRVELFRAALSDPQWRDPEGQIRVPFSTALDRLSPLTRNHKISYIEAEIIGSNVGDAVGRIYLRASGTSMTVPLGSAGMNNFYRFPERTAVVNTLFNGVRAFEPSVYQNDRLRDRPYVNTNWEILFSPHSEYANRDIDLSSLSDVRVYIHYNDFTAL